MGAEQYGSMALQIVRECGQEAPYDMRWYAHRLDDFLTAIPQWLVDRTIDRQKFLGHFKTLIESRKMEEATEWLKDTCYVIRTPWQYYVAGVINNSYF